MIDRTANLLAAVGSAVADHIMETLVAIRNHTGEMPAALVVACWGLSRLNESFCRLGQLVPNV
jgi:MarR family transcriptional regulator, negative regulator of the multidrug operon emrRAB